jgi:glycosyltransferase involved in cell wall biosynthesis
VSSAPVESRAGNDPLAILFVDHTGKPGGAELGLGRYLSHDSKFVRGLLLIEDGPLATSAREHGIRVEVLGAETNRWRTLLKLGRLKRALRQSPADIVIANSLRTAILLSLTMDKAKKYIYYLREDLSSARLGKIKRQLILRFVMTRFDGFLANSKWSASTVPATLSHLPVEVAFPISGTNGIHPRYPSEDKIPNSKLRLLSLSRLTHWKGIHVLLEAVKILQLEGLGERLNVTIAGGDIFGESQYQGQIQALAASLPGIVRVTGHVNDISPLLESNDVLVSCSLTPEPFGQVVIQALAAGLPVVATDHGGPKEILQGTGSGVLVRPGDPTQLAAEIRRLLMAPEVVSQMSARALQVAGDYSDKHLVEQFDESVLLLARSFADHDRPTRNIL